LLQCDWQPNWDPVFWIHSGSANYSLFEI